MQVDEKLEKIEKELQDLKALIIFGRCPGRKNPVSLRGICNVLVSEGELEKAIENARKSLFSGVNALRD